MDKGETVFNKKISFLGSGGNHLSANLGLPTETPRAYALFAHCFTCSKETIAAARISQQLTQLGIAVLRFDFTGLGNSQGDFSNTNFSSNVADLEYAAKFLRENYQAPQLLIGHSFGGAAVLAAANSIAEVKAIATIGAPSDPSSVEDLIVSDLDSILKTGEAEVMIGGRKFKIKKQFLDDIKNQQLLKKIAALKKELLIFHSPEDKIVDFKNAQLIFDAAPAHLRSFISLQNTDHLLIQKNDAIYVANLLTDWASRYITRTTEPSKSAKTPSSQVLVQETKETPFSQKITMGDHTLIADEPSSYGGRDLGPNPYDLVLAGLGACTAMTIRWYADRKQYPLGTVSVKLNHEKIHEKDCENCEEHPEKIDRIERKIYLQGDLTKEQREKLLEIANKCPVHETLTSKIIIKTNLED
jgi:uncharacterized OsmC-like protein/alpha/beta superfamily hydrolase